MVPNRATHYTYITLKPKYITLIRFQFSRKSIFSIYSGKDLLPHSGKELENKLSLKIKDAPSFANSNSTKNNLLCQNFIYILYRKLLGFFKNFKNTFRRIFNFQLLILQGLPNRICLLYQSSKTKMSQRSEHQLVQCTTFLFPFMKQIILHLSLSTLQKARYLCGTSKRQINRYWKTSMGTNAA